VTYANIYEKRHVIFDLDIGKWRRKTQLKFRHDFRPIIKARPVRDAFCREKLLIKSVFITSKYKSMSKKRRRTMQILLCFIRLINTGHTIYFCAKATFYSMRAIWNSVLFRNKMNKVLPVYQDYELGIFIPPPQNMGGAILDSLCRVGRSVRPSVRLQFVSAL